MVGEVAQLTEADVGETGEQRCAAAVARGLDEGPAAAPSAGHDEVVAAQAPSASRTVTVATPKRSARSLSGGQHAPVGQQAERDRLTETAATASARPSAGSGANTAAYGAERAWRGSAA